VAGRPRRLPKRWRYVAAFSDELMVCAARVQVGPLGQTFWAILDRADGRLFEGTRMRLPGGRGEVWREDGIDHVMSGRQVRARLSFGEGEWVEASCPAGDGYETRTRKRCDVPVVCEVRAGERRWEVEARGVEDESWGRHPRHTVWSWSAGIGRSADGRSVGWNLVSGINDPPRGSERAIWVDGEPTEPGPVSFDGLDGVVAEDGSRLDFSAEAERSAAQNLILVRYSYRQPFGTFSGALPGGLELESGLGVMEHHDALW
jgi:hypothetical protein